MCPDAARLRELLYQVCMQLTPPMDAQQAAAIASQERDKPERRSAVDALRQHVQNCTGCRNHDLP